MLLVCYSFLNSQNISIKNSVKRLVGRTPPKQLEKLLKLYRKTSNNWSMVNFIHNYFWNLKLQIIRLAQRHWGLRQVAKTAIFTAAPVTKTYLAAQFTKPCFFVNVFTEKLLV